METLFPKTIVSYMEVFASAFRANHFLYFRGFMVAFLLLGQTRKCVTNIARMSFFVERHISSWERFLSQYCWDLQELQQRLVSLLQHQLQQWLLIYGAYLGWVDTTLTAKVQGKMPGVQTWHDTSANPDRGDHRIGHQWALVGLLAACFLERQWTTLAFPILPRLVSGQLNPLGFVVSSQGVAQPMSFWDTVCPLIAQLWSMLGQAPLRIVADAYFAKAPFVNWMLALPVHVITRMRKDAVGWDDPKPSLVQKKRGRPRKHPPKGQQWKLADLLESGSAQWVSIWLYGKEHHFRVAMRDVWIRNVAQKVRVLVIQTQSAPVLLLSTDRTLTARQIITLYAMRFAAELGIRDAKQSFGLGDYQCVRLAAIVRFVGLSLISFCLWKLTLLTDNEAAWLKREAEGSPTSFRRLRRATLRFVMEQLFRKSAWEANFQNSDEVPEAFVRLFG